MRAFFAVLLLVPVIYSQVQVQQCENGLPTATSFEVVGCSSPPCGLEDGQDAHVIIGFNSPTNTTTLTATLTIIWGPFYLDYPLGDQANACLGIRGGCPLTAGNPYILDSTVHVDSPFDDTQEVTLELSVADDSGADVMCGQFDTTLNKN